LAEDGQSKSIVRLLRYISQNINTNQYMLMEYLGPVVDGCRAALNVSIANAKLLHKMSEDDFEEHMSSVTDSYKDLTICLRTSDIGDEYSVVFDRGKAVVYDECVEPDVVITTDEETLISICDSDPKVSPYDVLGTRLGITGSDNLDIVEGLGFLCYPTLLRIAKSGVDPSSLLSEDADSVIMAAASDLVIKMIRKWIDVCLSKDDVD
jgi:hypothetical protein